MKSCGSSLFPAVSSYPTDTFSFERELYRQGLGFVAGVDEAGRGPLAGPVVAACVLLPRDCVYQVFQDSKKLSARQRNQLFEVLQQNGALIGIGQAGPREIEQLNILQASLLAMKRAVAECTAANNGRAPNYLLVDGGFQIPTADPQLTLVKGESKSASIAAASIIAKVTRDRLMTEAHGHYPQYGFNRHQGYPTMEHRQAIRCHGPCPLHRRTFRGVVEFFHVKTSAPTPTQQDLWRRNRTPFSQEVDCPGEKGRVVEEK
jgi:ribonuclease HII